jgi:hypothetical protein
VVISADLARVTWCRGEADNPCEPVCELEDSEVAAGGTEEFGGEDRSESGHAQQHP